jgi:hypothetical protein
MINLSSDLDCGGLYFRQDAPQAPPSDRDGRSDVVAVVEKIEARLAISVMGGFAASLELVFGGAKFVHLSRVTRNASERSPKKPHHRSDRRGVSSVCGSPRIDLVVAGVLTPGKNSD